MFDILLFIIFCSISFLYLISLVLGIYFEFQIKSLNPNYKFRAIELITSCDETFKGSKFFQYFFRFWSIIILIFPLIPYFGVIILIADRESLFYLKNTINEYKKTKYKLIHNILNKLSE